MYDMEIEHLFLVPLSTRDVQKERTRRDILHTAIMLIHNGGEAALTMRAVANSADVTERTVYRHFQNRDVLLQAVWKHMAELLGAQNIPQSADALVDRPRTMFPRLDRMRGFVRAYLHRTARQKAPLEPDYRRQDLMVGCIMRELGDVDRRTLDRRASIAQVITSPYAWEMMQEFWGFSGIEAGEAAAEAIEVLLGRRRPD
jgi:AcrR family transcriptional regulator